MTEVRRAGAGGVVVAVEPGSVAEAAEIRPSDKLLAINGRRLRDVIDYQFYSTEDRLTLDIERAGDLWRIEVEKDASEPLGLQFEDPTFDKIRTCNNGCPFCFLKGLPKGLRKSLYIKDDDYRYSFLYGNFVTLTNLTEEDWERVFEQHLSPLYVSVHATEPDVRRQMLGNPRAQEILPQIDAISEAGMEVHTQVVLCPGQNDGTHLERTVEDLSRRYPAVQSIGVVPVGLTPRQTDLLARSGDSAVIIPKPSANGTMSQSEAEELHSLRTMTHCERVVPSGVRLYQPEEAAEVIAQVLPWQRRLRKEIGKTLVYLADEFYLLAGTPVPAGQFYDGYPQYENGIGMMRSSLDEWHRIRKRLAVAGQDRPRRRAALACGLLSATLWGPIVSEMRDLGFDITMVPVRNEFFGPSITVSGLLTGSDVIRTLQDSDCDVVFLPRYMLNTPGERTLDGWTPEEIRASLRTEVVFTTSIGAVAGALTSQ